MKKKINKVLALLIIPLFLSIFSAPAYAEIDSLDLSFNGVGYASHNNAAGGNGSDGAVSVAILDDGKFVIAGYSQGITTNTDLAIWRYNPDGTLDTTFNSVGYVTHSGAAGGNSVDRGYDIQIDNDGKYVIAGGSVNLGGNYDLAIWRFNENGTLDTTFNSVGYATHNNAAGGNSQDMGMSLIVLNNNKYVITGYSTGLTTNTDQAIWRYNNDGTLDTTFNGTGYATHNGAAGGTNRSESARYLDVQSDGKYVLIGNGQNNVPNQDIIVWRYNTDGTLDTTFNSVGYASYNNIGGGNGSDWGQGLGIQEDGKIVISGQTLGANDDMYLMRLNTDGSLDTSFNGVGYITHNNAAGGNGAEDCYTVSIQPDGKIITTGFSKNVSNNYDAVIWRFNPDGTIDTTFNGTGYAVFSNIAGGNLDDNGYYVSIHPDGSYILAGNSRSLANTDMFILKYKPQYQITSSFTAESGGLDISAGSANGAAGYNVEVILKDGTIIVTSMILDMWHDLDWSGVTGGTSVTEYKAFMNGLDAADSVSGIFDLLIPRRSGDQAVGICPHAATIDEIGLSCSGIYYKKLGDLNISAETINGIDYFRVSGLTGTGGFSIADLPQTGQRIMVPFVLGGLITFMTLWVVFATKIYLIRTKK